MHDILMKNLSRSRITGAVSVSSGKVAFQHSRRKTFLFKLKGDTDKQGLHYVTECVIKSGRKVLQWRCSCPHHTCTFYIKLIVCNNRLWAQQKLANKPKSKITTHIFLKLSDIAFATTSHDYSKYIGCVSSVQRPPVNSEKVQNKGSFIFQNSDRL